MVLWVMLTMVLATGEPGGPSENTAVNVTASRFYTLKELCGILTRNADERVVDRAYEGEFLFVSAGTFSVVALQDAVAKATGLSWRRVGPLELLAPQPAPDSAESASPGLRRLLLSMKAQLPTSRDVPFPLDVFRRTPAGPARAAFPELTAEQQWWLAARARLIGSSASSVVMSGEAAGRPLTPEELTHSSVTFFSGVTLCLEQLLSVGEVDGRELWFGRTRTSLQIPIDDWLSAERSEP
jgi:hypothetical protein